MWRFRAVREYALIRASGRARRVGGATTAAGSTARRIAAPTGATSSARTATSSGTSSGVPLGPDLDPEQEVVAAEGAGGHDAGEGAGGVGDQAVGPDRDPAAQQPGHVPAQEAGDELGRRPPPHLGGGADLFHPAGVHDRHPVGRSPGPRRGRG